MSLDTDVVMDRRLLRRKLTFWRVVAISAVILAIAAAGWTVGRRTGLIPGLEHVARIEVKGVITQNAEVIRMIDRIRQNRYARALVVTIDSPGGTVAGSEALYQAIRSVAAVKPTVAVVEGQAVSGGYIAAIATDHIVSRETSLTGSIGVIVQVPNVVRLLDHLGVRVDAVRSTPLKANPSGLEPTSPEAIAALREIVADSYTWFQRIVRERRAMSEDEVRTASDGRVFAGNRALSMKLIDTIGGETEARTWLASRGVARTLPIQRYRPSSTTPTSLIGTLAAPLLEAAGLTAFAERLRTTGVATQVELTALDGLLAVWQPPSP
ncbi:MAG: signal peptide peptidase SppA [Phreatobacter sp.]